jgi:hypothetical protein
LKGPPLPWYRSALNKVAIKHEVEDRQDRAEKARNAKTVDRQEADSRDQKNDTPFKFAEQHFDPLLPVAATARE